MVERSAKRQKKNFVSEDDISTVLQRYAVMTVLTLLQEVALEVQDAGNIDWNGMVKKTATGISSAREYQMLWRHLAYRDSLIDKLDDDAARPLDDDSDLECELEAFPAVSSEASAEAAACVKVLIASTVSNDPTSSTVEVPLTISIPKGQTSKALENSQSANCTLATNITVPITVQMQPMPSNTSAEGLDSNRAANATVPKRRRKWTLAEDQQLEAAVQNCGEGNWANILKGDFKGDRTASQLSQRWAILKKNRKGNLKVGTASQISDVHLATRRAVFMAIGDSTMPSCSLANAGASSNGAHSKLGQPAATETSNGGAKSLLPSQHDTAAGLGPSGSSKARVAPKKPPSTKTALSPDTMVTKSNLNTDSMASKTTLSPDSLVKAAAVAAGARIATASDAASLLKTAQSKNAVHIMPGCSLIKSSIAGSSSSLPSNVHLIRTGPPSRPLSSYSTAPSNALQPNGTHRMQGPSPKPAAAATQPNSASAASASDLSTAPETKRGANSVLHSGPDTKTVENTCSATKAIKELVLEGQADFTGEASSRQIGDQNAISSSTPVDVDASGDPPKDQEGGGQSHVLNKSSEEQAEGYGVSVSAAANTSKVLENRIDSAGSRLAAENGDHEIDRDDKSIRENRGSSEIKERVQKK